MLGSRLGQVSAGERLHDTNSPADRALQRHRLRTGSRQPGRDPPDPNQTWQADRIRGYAIDQRLT